MKLVIHADGGCAPNPGEMRIGLVVRDERGTLQHTMSKPYGYGTNNVAEWWAVIEALKVAREMRADSVTVQMDSRLVVEQINHRWKVKDKALQVLKRTATELWDELRSQPCSVRVEWVPREQNAMADALSR